MPNIIRVKKNSNYSVIDNRPLNDNSLSWEARGMLAYILTKPDGWQVRMADLINQSPGSRTKVRRIFKELEDHHYMKREKVRLPSGKFEYQTLVMEIPNQGTESTGGSPVDGKPDDIVITESINTEKEKSKDSSPTGDAPPTPPHSEKEKSQYTLRSEAMEKAFADTRGVPPPDWDNDPKGSNKRWRTPLNRMLTRADGNLRLTVGLVVDVTRKMMKDRLTFDAPDQIEKTFNSELADMNSDLEPEGVHSFSGGEFVDYTQERLKGK